MQQLKLRLREIGIAVLAIAASLLLRRLFFVEFFDQKAPAMPVIMGVIVAAWTGGLYAGLIATVLGEMALNYVFRFELNQTANPMGYMVRMAMFFAIGVSISWGFGSLKSSRRRLQDRQRELEREISERRHAETAERGQRQLLDQEMQRRAEAETALREREEHLRLAVDAANIGTWDFNPVTGERKWSERAKTMFGLPPDADVTQVSYLDRLHPEDRPRAEAAVARALDPSSDGVYEIECRVVWPADVTRWFIAKGQAIFGGPPNARHPVRFIGTVIETTQRRRAEEALRASESRLQAILNNTAAVIYLKDWQGKYLMVNRRYEELFHTTQERICGKTDAEIFPADVVATLQANDRQVRDTGQSHEFEEVVPQEDGPHTYISVKFPIFDAAGQCNAIGGISTDITDRSKALEALQLEQELSRHTIEHQEHERQLIAYEIHDGLVQYATGALMQLEALRNQVDLAENNSKLDSIIDVLQRAVDEGRRLINGIRTPVLDDWGIVPAVEQLIDEEDRAHVQIEFVKDDTLGRMAPGIEEALYRITQEALTNVTKHSQSKNVRVELGRRGDRVHLEIRDWGVGFTPSGSATSVHGLRGMSNRARIAGGTFKVESAAGKGTRILVDLPYATKI